MKKFHAFLLLFLAILGELTAGAYVYMTSNLNTETFYTGITIDGVSLGGLTREAAGELLYKTNSSRLENIRIKIKYGSKQWVFGYKDIQASLDIENKLDRAYFYGRKGNILQRYLDKERIKTSGYSLKTDLLCDPDNLEDKLQTIAAKYNKKSVNATVHFDPASVQKFSISPEIDGLNINTSEAIEKIKSKLSQGNDMTVELASEKIPPEVKARDFISKTEKIVTFGTDLSKSPQDRTHNILKAASAFNGLVVQPGQTVSFNTVTGERTVSKGYRFAPMIQNNRFVDVPGGGVSQTSTTLYNTVIRAGLEVLEWKRHSIPSSYVDKGLDTTVNFANPEIDLKFKNTRSSPIYIRTFFADKKVYFEMYGEPLPNRGEFKFHSEVYATVAAPNPNVIKDSEGKYVKYWYEHHIYRESRGGYKVRVHRELYENGKLLSRTLFDQHYYEPIKGLIHTGVKEPEQLHSP